MDIKLTEEQAVEILDSAIDNDLIGIYTEESFETSPYWLVECTAYSYAQNMTTYFEFKARSQAREFQNLLQYNGLTAYIYTNRSYHAHN